MYQPQPRNMATLTLMIAGLVIVMLPWPKNANAACGATVNGAPMTAEQCSLARQLYGSVEPGHYWMNAEGTWGVLGDPTPRGNVYSGTYHGRDGAYGGSGERSGNGSWVHRQDDLLGGGAVGGDGNGCYYADGWSNC